jgi:hypothetical protein
MPANLRDRSLIATQLVIILAHRWQARLDPQPSERKQTFSSGFYRENLAIFDCKFKTKCYMFFHIVYTNIMPINTTPLGLYCTTTKLYVQSN